MSNSPYSNLAPEKFWKSGVGEQHPLSIRGLYKKKFQIRRDMKIATAGSCFAQHIGGHLRAAGYDVMDVEPAPKALVDKLAREYGYNVYSARYGNIYLSSQLLQLFQEAYGLFSPSEPVWEKEGRFYDAMRPSVEPLGLSSPAEVLAHRVQHLAAVRKMIETMDVFIFTFGLTEGWLHRASKTCYPTAPGTIAGAYDAEKFVFRNFRTSEIRRDFLLCRDLILSKNPGCKFLITVSPVPLTATASAHHVLSATTYSKSVLRAVAGELADKFKDIDYFPSYELIASPFSRGFFYSSNLRTVEAQGVLAVMRVFFAEHPVLKSTENRVKISKALSEEDVICEEAILEAFAK